MFKKDEQKLESFIGGSSSFKGNICIKGTLRIDGEFSGEIEADWIVVGENGRVTGNVQAKCMIIGGYIGGNLRAKETVEIKSKGQVNGDICTAKLSVHEGGVLNGNTAMQGGEGAKIAEFQKENAVGIEEDGAELQGIGSLHS